MGQRKPRCIEQERLAQAIVPGDDVQAGPQIHLYLGGRPHMREFQVLQHRLFPCKWLSRVISRVGVADKGQSSLTYSSPNCIRTLLARLAT